MGLGLSKVMATVRDPDLDRIESEPMTRAARQEPDVAMDLLRMIFRYILNIILFFFVLLPLIGGRLTLWTNWSMWWDIIANINPTGYAALGVSLALSLSIVGASWGILLSGSSIAGAAVRTPRMTSRNLISIVFCEAVGIYGLIIALLMNNKIKSADNQYFSHSFSGGERPAAWMKFGVASSMYTILAAGLTVGMGNFACGLAVGLVGSSCAIADAADKDLFVQILIVEIFASALGIFALIIGILQANSANFEAGPPNGIPH